MSLKALFLIMFTIFGVLVADEFRRYANSEQMPSDACICSDCTRCISLNKDMPCNCDVGCECGCKESCENGQCKAK